MVTLPHISKFLRLSVILKFLTLTLLIYAFHARAEEFPEPSQEMNGIDLRKLKGFEEDWHLVTVRYREDRHEQRITYANDLAWETLSKGKTDYPDGAIFGKISLILKDDPQFISSKVPTEKTKIQFMVKDKQKYKETDGWGYALFSPLGFTLKEDRKKQTLACHACHQVVANRGFVFSERMPISTLNFSSNQPIGKPLFADSFKVVKSSKLPESVSSVLNPKTKSVSLYEGPITKHVFTGTIDEMRPILINEHKAKKNPAILVSEDKEHFVLVAAEEQISIKPAEPGCKSDESRLVVISKNGREEARRDYFLCIRQ